MSEIEPAATVPPTGPPTGVAIVDGIPIDDVSLDEAVDMIRSFVDRGRRDRVTFQIATVNVDFVVNAHGDPPLRRLLRRADLALADGMPIVWHSRLTGTPLGQRVAGADLVPRLVEQSARTGHRVLLFGSAAGVAERARDLLRERFPGALVDGLSGPIMRTVEEMEPSVIAEIDALAPDIICVALGNPKQERWIDHYRDRVGASVFIGVGGTLDFLVGGRRRAPKWMQRFGLEWVYRAWQEPKRLGRRYVRDGVVFGPIMARTLLTRLWPPWRRRLDEGIRIEDRLHVGASGSAFDATSLDDSNRGVCEVLAHIRTARRSGIAIEVAGAGPALKKALVELTDGEVSFCATAPTIGTVGG